MNDLVNENLRFLAAQPVGVVRAILHNFQQEHEARKRGEHFFSDKPLKDLTDGQVEALILVAIKTIEANEEVDAEMRQGA